MKPTIGRIVIFRTQEIPDRAFPAIVQRVWGESETACINVAVFFDDRVEIRTSVQHESLAGAMSTWEWPARA